MKGSENQIANQHLEYSVKSDFNQPKRIIICFQQDFNKDCEEDIKFLKTLPIQQMYFHCEKKTSK